MPVTTTLRSNFTALANDLRVAEDEITLGSAMRIAATAHDLAPEETGSLKETVGAGPAPQMGPHGAAAWAGNVQGGYEGRDNRSGGAVDYALEQEFGSSRNPARPFMWPAIELELSRGQGIIAAYLNGVIARRAVPPA